MQNAKKKRREGGPPATALFLPFHILELSTAPRSRAMMLSIGALVSDVVLLFICSFFKPVLIGIDSEKYNRASPSDKNFSSSNDPPSRITFIM